MKGGISFSDAAEYGVFGIISYWMMWAMDVIPIGFFVYCIYLSSLLGNGYWIDCVGGGALACCIIALIIQLAAALSHVAYQFSLFSISVTVWKYVYISVSIVALIISAVLLTFFTPTVYQRSISQLYEYTTLNNGTDSSASHYFLTLDSNGASHSLNRLAIERTFLPKGPVVSFFVLWLIYFLIYVTTMTKFSESNSAKKDELEQLLPDDQEEPNAEQRSNSEQVY